jgi:putative endonuclease
MPEYRSNRRKGTEYEDIAVEYMKQHQMQVVEQNYRCRQGEIDIIGREEDYLLFVEVKYRKDAKKGYPAEAVTPTKRLRILQTARYYLYTHHFPETTKLRFDVVAILGDEIQYIKDAFSVW